VKVLLTGAHGFLGWHTRARLRAIGSHEITAVGRHDWGELNREMRGVDAVVHVAGVNRGSDAEIEAGNVALARDLAAAVRDAGSVRRIVFANSIQHGNGTPYGRGKSVASDLLAAAAGDLGADYVDVRLPNLFGEHGRPHYNSFVATFADAAVRGATPTIADRPVHLLHAQQAAQTLIDALTTTANRLDPAGTPTGVRDVWDILREFQDIYAASDVPPLDTDLHLDLFNTLRAARFPADHPLKPTPRVDHRGRLVEVVRAHGGQGQTFVSTTRPGITRGEHFHLRKVERFVVLSGRARISLRRLFSEEVVSFDVTGGDPSVVDMPTMWAHNITNTGSDELTTLFWTQELFDPAAPDTYPEPVGDAAREAVSA